MCWRARSDFFDVGYEMGVGFVGMGFVVMMSGSLLWTSWLTVRGDGEPADPVAVSWASFNNPLY